MRKFLAALLALIVVTPALAATAPNYSPPFGLWRLPTTARADLPFNFTSIGFEPGRDSPQTVLASLDAARASRMHVLLTLEDFGKMQEDPPGNFQIETWRQRYSAWCPNGRCLDLRSYVQDGTIMAMHIFEYSSDESAAQRLTPTMPQIHQVAAMIKTLWPYMPIAIDSAHPCLLTQENWQHSVDIVLITLFTIRQTNFAHGEALLNRETACAQQAGMRFTLGPNPFGGLQTGMTPTSLSSFRHYEEYSILYPGSMGTITWRWWGDDQPPMVSNGKKSFANFWSEQVNPGIGATMREIENCAAQRTQAACPAARPGGYADGGR